jgi:DNA gyrase subunit A
VKGISRYGRASQGVRVMNIRDDDLVSAVAVVVEDSADTAAGVAEELPSVDAGDTTSQPVDLEVPGGNGAEASGDASGGPDGADAPDNGSEGEAE